MSVVARRGLEYCWVFIVRSLGAYKLKRTTTQRTIYDIGIQCQTGIQQYSYSYEV